MLTKLNLVERDQSWEVAVDDDIYIKRRSRPSYLCHHPQLLHHCAITVDCRSNRMWSSLCIVVPRVLLLSHSFAQHEITEKLRAFSSCSNICLGQHLGAR
jgi:hypothetical protein